MSEPESTESEIERDTGSRAKNFIWRQAPYIIVLVLALTGVAYTNISHEPLAGYWEFLAVAIGVVCVVTQWEYFPGNSARFHLAWTQALHWAAVLVAMNIMVLSRVQSMFPAPAVGLVLLTLLALGTFLAGVRFLSPQICFLGVAMGFGVPAIAWLTQSFLFILLIGALLIGLAMTFWPSRGGKRAANAGSP